MSGRHEAVAAAPAHPVRRVVRTAFAVVVALAVLIPSVIEAVGIDRAHQPRLYAIAAGALFVASAITRVLALPSVELFLRQFVPWLSASDTAAESVAAVATPAGVVVAGPAAPQPDGTPVAVVGEDEAT